MTASAEVQPRIALEHVRVTFGGTVALADEGLEVHPGEIVGLLGHNGAGKSTLVNVATGALQPDAGTMRIDGRPVALSGTPSLMEREGIKVIHQDPALVGNLSVADNIALGRQGERRNRSTRRREARETLAAIGCDVDPDRPVETLDLGARQLVDLARALSGDVKVLFLDEPTGALGQHEADRLHELLRDLAADGKAIVYVSHRLRDIVEVCTRIVVLREGRTVMDRPAEGLSVDLLAEALSPGVDVAHRPAAARSSQRALEVSWGGEHLTFAKGEIVGMYGMAGGPQYELLSALFGLGGPVETTLDGRRFCPRSPRDAISRHVFLVTADRERDALIPEMSALDNLVLPWVKRLSRRGAISRRRTASLYEGARTALSIAGAAPSAPISAFSGGNRQKHVLGRWLFGDPPVVLLLCQPTQGVDVGARVDIARALRQVADEGVTVLVASSETDEIGLLCDRAVICQGAGWTLAEREPHWEERLLAQLLERTDDEEIAA